MHSGQDGDVHAVRHIVDAGTKSSSNPRPTWADGGRGISSCSYSGSACGEWHHWTRTSADTGCCLVLSARKAVAEGAAAGFAASHTSYGGLTEQDMMEGASERLVAGEGVGLAGVGGPGGTRLEACGFDYPAEG